MDIKGEVFNVGLALQLQKVATVADNLFDYDSKNAMPSYNSEYTFFEVSML